MILVIMGVSGSGKSTIAEGLRRKLGWQYQEGDGLHPPSNVAKMSAGTPLTDEDRLPWLRKIAERIDQWRTEGVSGIVTCSALKRAYRDIIAGGRPDVMIVYPRGSQALIGGRMAERKGHFMPASLLESQFKILEEPSPDENAMTVDIDRAPDAIVDEIARRVEERAKV